MLVSVERPCRECKKNIIVSVPEDGLAKYKAGALIQEAFPSLSANKREFLISGICGTCFDKIWKDEE